MVHESCRTEHILHFQLVQPTAVLPALTWPGHRQLAYLRVRFEAPKH